ncbi:hypothetical protein MKW92_049546, partial [Papaver armeniacum]
MENKVYELLGKWKSWSYVTKARVLSKILCDVTNKLDTHGYYRKEEVSKDLHLIK